LPELVRNYTGHSAGVQRGTLGGSGRAGPGHFPLVISNLSFVIVTAVDQSETLAGPLVNKKWKMENDLVLCNFIAGSL
jgi:hypothetical protein